MKIIILGGFLGSGKTTVLLQLAPYLARCSNSGKDPSVVVLENEISATDVDTKLLQSRNLTTRNLAAGCICCTSSVQLVITKHPCTGMMCRVTSAYFQAVGNKQYALSLNLIIFALLPLLALVFSGIYGVNGVYLSFLPAYGLVAVICITLLLQNRRKCLL